MVEPHTVADARAQIDRLDQQIQGLITERARWARRIGLAKAAEQAAAEYYRADREAQVLRRVVDRNQGPLSNEELVRVFREIMSACLAQQEPLKIAYLGPEGTFCQVAVHRHFGQSVRSLPLATVDEAVQEVEAGAADYAVVPVENSSEGAVINTLDVLLQSPLRICGEVEMRIRQNLLARTAHLAQIQRVYGHPQSLAQTRLWLREHLPQAERVPVASNAEGARRARQADDAAAIGSDHAAEIYGLQVLERGIEDRPDNTTRFLVLGRNSPEPSGHDKTSLLLAARDQPGALYHLLDPLARAGVSMTRIESRPSRQGRWEYVFFIDVAGHADEPQLRGVLEALGPVADQVRVLGSYPVAVV